MAINEGPPSPSKGTKSDDEGEDHRTQLTKGSSSSSKRGKMEKESTADEARRKEMFAYEEVRDKLLKIGKERKIDFSAAGKLSLCMLCY